MSSITPFEYQHNDQTDALPDVSLLTFLSPESQSSFLGLITLYNECYLEGYLSDEIRKIVSLQKQFRLALSNQKDKPSPESMKVLANTLKEYVSITQANKEKMENSLKVDWYIKTSQFLRSGKHDDELGPHWDMQAQFAHYSSESLIEALFFLKQIKVMLKEAESEFKQSLLKIGDRNFKEFYQNYLNSNLSAISLEKMKLVYSMLSRLKIFSDNNKSFLVPVDVVLSSARKLNQSGISVDKIPSLSSLKPLTGAVFNNLHDKIIRYLSKAHLLETESRKKFKQLDIEKQFHNLAWFVGEPIKGSVGLYKRETPKEKRIVVVPSINQKKMAASLSSTSDVIQNASVYEIAEYGLSLNLVKRKLIEFDQVVKPFMDKYKRLDSLKLSEIKGVVQEFLVEKEFIEAMNFIVVFLINHWSNYQIPTKQVFYKEWNSFIQSQIKDFLSVINLFTQVKLNLLVQDPYNCLFDIQLLSSLKNLLQAVKHESHLSQIKKVDEDLAAHWMVEIKSKRLLDKEQYANFFNLWDCCASLNNKFHVALLSNLVHGVRSISFESLTNTMKSLYKEKSEVNIAYLLDWLVDYIEEPDSFGLSLLQEYDQIKGKELFALWADKQKEKLSKAITTLEGYFPLNETRTDFNLKTFEKALSWIFKYSVHAPLAIYRKTLGLHMTKYLQNPFAIHDKYYVEVLKKLEDFSLLTSFALKRFEYIIGTDEIVMVSQDEPLHIILPLIDLKAQNKIKDETYTFCLKHLSTLIYRFSSWDLLKNLLKDLDSEKLSKELHALCLAELKNCETKPIDEFINWLAAVKKFGIAIDRNFFVGILNQEWTFQGHHIIHILQPDLINNYRLCRFQQFLTEGNVKMARSMVQDEFAIKGFGGLKLFFGEEHLGAVLKAIEDFFKSSHLNFEAYGFLGKVFSENAVKNNAVELDPLYPSYIALKSQYEQICDSNASLDSSILEAVREGNYSFALKYIKGFLFQESKYQEIEKIDLKFYKILFVDLVEVIGDLIYQHSTDSQNFQLFDEDFIAPLHRLIDKSDKIIYFGAMNKLERICALAPAICQFYQDNLSNVDSFIKPNLFSILETLPNDRKKQISQILLRQAFTTDNSQLNEAYWIMNSWLTAHAGEYQEKEEIYLQTLLGSVYLDEIYSTWTRLPKHEMDSFIKKTELNVAKIRSVFSATKNQLGDLKTACAMLKQFPDGHEKFGQNLFERRDLVSFTAKVSYYLKRLACDYHHKKIDVSILKQNVDQLEALIKAKQEEEYVLELQCDLFIHLIRNSGLPKSQFQGIQFTQLATTFATCLLKLYCEIEDIPLKNVEMAMKTEELVNTINRLSSLLAGPKMEELRAACLTNQFPENEFAKLSHACHALKALTLLEIGGARFMAGFKEILDDLSFAKKSPSVSSAQWQSHLQKLFPIDGPGILVESTSLGKRKLNVNVYDQLFGENGNLKEEHLKIAEEKKYRHAVPIVQLDGLKFYFKFLPDAPGIQTMTRVWEKVLFGDALSFEVVKFPAGTAGQQHAYTVMISPEVPGDTIHDLWKNQIEFKIESRSYSQNFLRCLFDREHDGKPDNYIGKPVEGNPFVRSLVPVDLEKAYGSPVIRKDEGLGLVGIRLITKSILFCVENFQAPLDQTVVEEFLKIDPEVALRSFIAELASYNKRYLDLFDFKICLDWMRRKEPIIIPALPRLELIAELYEIFCLTQDNLRKNPKILPGDLLQLIHKHLGAFCEDLYKRFPFLKDSSCLEQHRMAYLRFYDIAEKNNYKIIRKADSSQVNFLSTASNNEALKAMYGTIPKAEEVLKAEVVEAKEAFECLEKIVKQRKELVELQDQLKRGDVSRLENILPKDRAKEAFFIDRAINGIHGKLEPLKLSSLDVKIQKKILQALVGFPLSAFNLNGCKQSLTPELLLQLLHPCLQILDVRGCHLNDKVMDKISALPQLRILDLSGMPLTSLGKNLLVMTIPITFPELNYLYMNMCRDLTSLIIKAPKLRRLEASYCRKLIHLDVDCPKEATASLWGCALPEKEVELKKVSLSSSNYSTAVREVLKIEGKTFEKETDPLLIIRKLLAPIKRVNSFHFIPSLNFKHEKEVIEMILRTYGAKLREVSLANCLGVDNELILKLIQYCKNLRKLDLSGCINLEIEAFSHFTWRKFNKINSLNLSRCSQLTDEAFCQMVSCFPDLMTINLNGCRQLTSASISSLAEKCPRLEKVSILGFHQIDSLLEKCRRLRTLAVGPTELKHLDVKKLNLNHSSLTHLLDNSPLLETIILSPMKAESLFYGEYFTNKQRKLLFELEKRGVGIKSPDLEVEKMTWEEKNEYESKVKSLNLKAIQFIENLINNLNKYPRLKLVKISYFGEDINLDQALISLIENCQILTTLDLGHAGYYTEKSLIKLGECKNLEELNLHFVRLNIALLESIVKGCPRLRCLRINNENNYTLPLLSVLADAPSLDKLEVKCLDDVSLDHILKNCSKLKSLTLGNARNLSEVGFKQASQLEHLEIEYFESDPSKNLLSAILEKCPKLKTLNVTGEQTSIPGLGFHLSIEQIHKLIPAIENRSELEEIYFKTIRFDEASLCTLLKDCKNLKIIHFSNQTEFTLKVLEMLRNCPKLEEIHFGYTRMNCDDLEAAFHEFKNIQSFFVEKENSVFSKGNNMFTAKNPLEIRAKGVQIKITNMNSRYDVVHHEICRWDKEKSSL